MQRSRKQCAQKVIMSPEVILRDLEAWATVWATSTFIEGDEANFDSGSAVNDHL